jgi:hypothetical protein
MTFSDNPDDRERNLTPTLQAQSDVVDAVLAEQYRTRLSPSKSKPTGRPP